VPENLSDKSVRLTVIIVKVMAGLYAVLCKYVCTVYCVCVCVCVCERRMKLITVLCCCKSLQHFVSNCGDYAVHMVDNLLDILTDCEHSKTNAVLLQV